MQNMNDNAAIITAMEENLKLHLVEHDGIKFVAAPRGYELRSIKPMLDEYRTAPERLKGTSMHTELKSFIDHINLFKRGTTGEWTPTSAVFAGAEQLTAVYDYATPNQPSFREHRATYKLNHSPEWATWKENDGVFMDQAEFAAFIEANVLDLWETPIAKSEMDAQLMEIARMLNTKYASPSQMMEFSRGIAIYEDARATSFYDNATGSQIVEFTSELKDSSNKKLNVPGLFLICIPVYVNGDRYRIPLRLRLRKKDGAILWSYQIYRADKYVKDAFDGLCAKVVTETSLPVYRGSPE